MSRQHKSSTLASALASAVLLGSLAAGCTGNIDQGSASAPGSSGVGGSGTSPGGPGAGGAGMSACVGSTRLAQRIRPLNSAQYGNTIRAVFPDAGQLRSPFEVSDRSAEFSTNANLRRFDFDTSLGIMTNGQTVAEASLAQIKASFACLAQSADSNCSSELVKTLGRSLYRAPLSADQATKLSNLFEAGNKLAGPDAAIKLVVRALLSSPLFLFHRELGQPSAESGSANLTAHEIANAISFAVTNAPPDALLSQAADAGELSTPAKIREHALRLLGGERGLTGLQAFMTEFFRTRDFVKNDKDKTLFPLFDSETRSQALADFADTIAGVLRSSEPTLASLLTTRKFVVRPRTAALLGWSDLQNLSPDGSTVEASEQGRAGILTHPVFLANFAHANETNPVARGHFVTSNVLCVDIPPPPQAVKFPERTNANDGSPRTLRQVLQSEHSMGTCAGCHQFMDPVGYPFEVFDAVGKLRSTDNGLPIDASGSISGAGEIDGPVASAQEMLGKIAGSARAQDCFAERVYKYVAGVDASPTLECSTSSLKSRFREQQGNVLELVVGLLQSPEFLAREVVP